MRICGLKLTHDGAIALIEDGKLVFSIEMEKLNNNARYTGIEDTGLIGEILRNNGYDPADIDVFSIDGWGGYDQEALAIQPRLEIGEEINRLSADHFGQAYSLRVAQYRERTLQHDVLQEWSFDGLQVDQTVREYSTFLHVTGHLMSAYCCSPFAQKNESAYLLIWDGGMYPRLYYFDAEKKQMENFGPIFLMIGNIYSIFAQHFGPFKVKSNFAKDSLSVAGKVMAYIAKGNVHRDLFSLFDEIYEAHYAAPMGFANIFANEFKKLVEDRNYSDEDILASFHQYLEELLVRKLIKKVQRYPRPHRNLCLAGGCALNIKWNRSIRSSGFFTDVFVPPFPNDSGSAIGAACAAMGLKTGSFALDWTVYAGPAIENNQPAANWEEEPCSVEELARLLFRSGEPVVFLNGRAELGPRALGNRSILASPVSPGMKDLLNYVKKREPYRPVSPICMEDHAADIFLPGTPDPYMLFDHFVKPEWLDRIPAVCHLDGTARLQTVNQNENQLIYELLSRFFQLSGIPMLCNTSANHSGSGFFPDVYSATEWDRVNYVWCENTLFTRKERIPFQELIPNLQLEGSAVVHKL